MARKKWFRVYHGLVADLSLAVAAGQAGITRNDMVVLWLCLLDHASRAEPAGSIAHFDTDEAALLLGITHDKVTQALAVLRARKKIDAHQRITGWDKYQPTSTRRVRALRQRRKGEGVAPAPRATPTAARNAVPDHDSPAAIAARRARLQHNNALIIGQPPRNK